MSSMYGNLAYVQYVKGTDKGESAAGDKTADIWSLGKMDSNYTSQNVIDTFTGDGTKVEFEPMFSATKLTKVTVAGVEVEIEESTGTVTAGKVALVDGKIKFGTAPASAAEIKCAYVYDNQVVPQDKLPTLKAVLKNIPLEARARRIAVYYLKEVA